MSKAWRHGRIAAGLSVLRIEGVSSVSVVRSPLWQREARPRARSGSLRSGIGPGDRTSQQSGQSLVFGCKAGSEASEYLRGRDFPVATIGDRSRVVHRVWWEPEPVEHPVAGPFGILEVILGKENENAFGPKGFEPPLELFRIPASGEVGEVFVRPGDGMGMVEEALRLASKPGRFLFDRVLEVEGLDAEPSLMSMVRPRSQGGITKQHHEIDLGTQQVAGDRRGSRMKEVVGAGVAGSKSATESIPETIPPEAGLLKASVTQFRWMGAGEDPALFRRPRENAGRTGDSSIEIGGSGLLDTDQEEVRKNPPRCGKPSMQARSGFRGWNAVLRWWCLRHGSDDTVRMRIRR